MILLLKKINIVLKNNNIHLLLALFYFLNIFKSLKNYLKIIVSDNSNSIYIPNMAIKNVIYINPNKIEYVNSIPLKFNRSTKLIMDFDWDKNNRLLKNDLHPTFVTCSELFVEYIPSDEKLSSLVIPEGCLKLLEAEMYWDEDGNICYLEPEDLIEDEEGEEDEEKNEVKEDGKEDSKIEEKTEEKKKKGWFG